MSGSRDQVPIVGPDFIESRFESTGEVNGVTGPQWRRLGQTARHALNVAQDSLGNWHQHPDFFVDVIKEKLPNLLSAFNRKETFP